MCFGNNVIMICGTNILHLPMRMQCTPNTSTDMKEFKVWNFLPPCCTAQGNNNIMHAWHTAMFSWWSGWSGFGQDPDIFAMCLPALIVRWRFRRWGRTWRRSWCGGWRRCTGAPRSGAPRRRRSTSSSCGARPPTTPGGSGPRATTATCRGATRPPAPASPAATTATMSLAATSSTITRWMIRRRT